MLSLQTIQELRSELVELQRRASAIEAILAGVNDVAQERPIIPPPPVAENGTFASEIRRALRAIGRTTTSRDLAAWIEQQGGSRYTTRPLRSAVAVELFRMSKKATGGVRKVSRGRYRIGPVQGEGPHRESSTGLQ